MNHLMIPSQITWHLAWSDLFILFQNLHTAICAKDSLQRVIFAGDNTIICQNLQRVWQQFIEDIADENGYVAEVDLMPVGSAIATHLNYTASDRSKKQLYSNDIGQLLQLPTEPPLLMSGVEAGVLMTAKNFLIWLNIQPDPFQAGNQPWNAPQNPFSNFNYELYPCWQVTLVLEPKLIRQVFKDAGLSAISPMLSEPREQIEQGPLALHHFWTCLLHQTQSATAAATLVTPASPAPCLLQPLLQQMPMGVFQANLDGSFSAVNPAFCQLIGYSEAQLLRLDLPSITEAEDFRLELELIQQVVHYNEQRIFEKRYRRADGSTVWAEVKLAFVGDSDDEDGFLLGFVTDLSDRRQIEVERLQAIQEIQQRQDRETLINNIAIRIRSAIDLPTMLHHAAAELNQALRADRVVIYQIAADGTGVCVSEAVNPLFSAMQGQVFGSDCIPPPFLDAYRTGRLWSVDDISQVSMSDCHRQMLEQVQVRSMVATGILSMDESLQPSQRQLWGLLAVHQCEFQRSWTSAELHLIEAVANQLAIALEQTKLLNELTRYTEELENRVNQRTRSLERSLKFEQFIRSLTECLYREFDENQLFQIIVQGLVSTLEVDACLVSLYNPEHHTLEVKFEAFSDQFATAKSCLGQQIDLDSLPVPVQAQHWNRYICDFNNNLEKLACLFQFALPEASHATKDCTPQWSQIIRPIMGVDHQVGMVLLLQLQAREFEADEVALVEQTTNYCAIALRQAHLYRQEHEQRLSAEYLRSFLEKSIDVYVEYDAQLRYKSLNPAGCALFGRELNEIIGKTNQDLLPHGAHDLEELVRQVFNTAEQVFVDHEILLPQGSRMFESVYAPITDPAGIVQRVIGVCRDITDFKHQWQLLEKQNHQLTETTRLKQEFVATTSHELRTPLTAILGFSNVLLQEFAGELNSRQKDYIERIYGSGQHLLELINDILDLSRLEAGKMELDCQVIYIADICEAVIGLLQERAANHGLSLVFELDPGVEWMVADPRRLKQMLLNLLMNAIKFTANGSVGLRIYRDECGPTQSPMDCLSLPKTFSSNGTMNGTKPSFIHFQVWDTGVGITEADQRSLFTPFTQLDSSLDRKHQGSGLGLVITQKLAELHGGSVSLQSAIGVGSQFTITLPLRTITDN